MNIPPGSLPGPGCRADRREGLGHRHGPGDFESGNLGNARLQRLQPGQIGFNFRLHRLAFLNRLPDVLKEVLKGDLDDAIFAADFGDLVAGKAPKVYGDASTFFQNTNPAKQLCKVIEAVFSRLALRPRIRHRGGCAWHCSRLIYYSLSALSSASFASA